MNNTGTEAMWNKADGFKQAFAAHPVRVGLEITQACNLRCRHCSAESRQRQADELSLNEIKERILDRAARFGGLRIILISGGEPLLRPDLMDLLAMIQESKSVDRIHMASNGTLLNEKTVEQLKARHVGAFHVSLDSADQITLDSFRGQVGAFAKATRGLRMLASAQFCEVGIHSVITTFNWDKITAIVDLALNLGVKVFSIERFLPIGQGKNSYSEYAVDSTRYRHALQTLYELKVKYKDDIYHLGGPAQSTCGPRLSERFRKVQGPRYLLWLPRRGDRLDD